MNDKDIFKEQLKAKFEDFEAPVPQDGWKRLESSLSKSAPVRTIWRWVSVAAAVAVLIAGGLWVVRQPETTAPSVSQSAQVGKTQKQDITAPSTLSQVIAQAVTSLASANNSAEESLHKISNPALHAKANDYLNIEEVYYRYLDEKERQMNEADSEPDLYDNESIDLHGTEDVFHVNRDVRNEEIPLPRGNKEKLSLTMKAKGGLNAVQRTLGTPVTLRSASSNETAKSLMSNTSKEPQRDPVTMSEMVHHQPISFGFTVSKNIVGSLSVETGIVYTQLNSSAKNIATDTKEKETLQFHYLGVPLNLNYTVFHLKKLNMYVSVGGMVEKNVSGRWQYIDTSVSDLSGESNQYVKVSVKQPHPQFSINSGVGASFPLLDKLSLYGKVGGSYYFNTENPYKTIYSDRKIVLDLSLGLKYDF